MPRVITFYFATITHTEGVLTKEDADVGFFHKYTPCCIAEEPHYSLEKGRRKNNGSHLHVLFQDTEKVGIKKMQEQLADYLKAVRKDRPTSVLGLDLQPCRSPKNSLVYITKTDVAPVLRGFDFDQLSTLCKVHSVAMDTPYTALDPLSFNLRAQYNFMTNVWNDIYDAHEQCGSCRLCRGSLGILRNRGDDDDRVLFHEAKSKLRNVMKKHAIDII